MIQVRAGFSLLQHAKHYHFYIRVMDRRPSMIALNVTFVPMTLPLRSFTLVRYGPLGNGHEVYTHRSQVSSVSYETAPAAHVHQ
jgi:hypothetical protein